MKRLFLLLLFACSSVPVVVFENGVSVDVELARTPEERAQGLMFREALPHNAGMLFVFDDVSPRSFWMKNTLLPLDMIFIDENMRVVEVKSNVPPCSADPCQSYHSLPAKYVLEVNAGFAERENISVGFKMELRE